MYLSRIAFGRVLTVLGKLVKLVSEVDILLSLQLLEALDQDSSARKLHLADKFEEITDMMDETPIF